jgi:hypothetical protein
VTVRYDPMHSTIRTAGNIYNIIGPTQYDTTRYEPRAIGLQYIHAHVRQTPHSTFDPRFVLYFLGEYSTVRYDTTRYEPRVIQYNTCTYDKPRTVRPDAQYDTIRHDTNRGRYNTNGLQTANPAQYDTTRSEPRAIGLQYNTYMYGKTRTVHTICGSYCISSGSMIRYELRECRLQTERLYLRSARFSSTPRGFSWYDLRFVLYFLGAYSDRTSNFNVTNRSRPDQDTIQSDTYLWNWLYHSRRSSVIAWKRKVWKQACHCVVLAKMIDPRMNPLLLSCRNLSRNQILSTKFDGCPLHHIEIRSL